MTVAPPLTQPGMGTDPHTSRLGGGVLSGPGGDLLGTVHDTTDLNAERALRLARVAACGVPCLEPSVVTARPPQANSGSLF